MTATDESALLTAIVAHPGDDTPRLVYADFLDEQAAERGEPLPCPRSEFIRVQCEIARLETDPDAVTGRVKGRLGNQPSAGFVRLADCRARERELLERHELEWRGARPCPKCEGRKTAGRTDGAAMYWADCLECDGSGVVGELVQRGTRWLHNVTFRRGFLHRVECPHLSDAIRSGDSRVQTTAWLRAVVKRHPTVAEVVPLDLAPDPDSAGVFCWFSEPNAPHGFPTSPTLSGALFAALARAQPERVRPSRSRIEFPTREEAVSALGALIVAVARGRR